MDSQEREIDVQDNVAGLYENVRYKKLHSKKYKEWRMEQLTSFLGPEKVERLTILDDGCGVGHLSEWLSDRRGDEILLFGTDLSSKMLKYASRHTSGQYCQANSEQLPFRDDSFDVVFANSLLHHLLSPNRGLSEIHRVLKSGGLVCLVDPNRSLITSFVRRLFQRPDHFSEVHKEFSSRELLHLVRTRFTIVSFKYFGYVAYPLLGFPDVLDLFTLFRLPVWSVRFFISIDEAISRIPLLRSQSFGIMICARKGSSD